MLLAQFLDPFPLALAQPPLEFQLKLVLWIGGLEFESGTVTWCRDGEQIGRQFAYVVIVSVCNVDRDLCIYSANESDLSFTRR